MDIYLLEAVLNGILLGGVLALLALGLNLIFGVVDVVWIAYAELVMCGMYAIWWLYAFYGWPFFLSAPVNQLLATGGFLFFVQSFATLLFGTDFRNIGLRLPLLEFGDVDISFAR